jgi:hypothetical protein
MIPARYHLEGKKKKKKHQIFKHTVKPGIFGFTHHLTQVQSVIVGSSR